MIHKQILDAAETDPDASLEAVAAEVPGASADLVERVLDEYGDPAESSDEQSTATPTPQMSQNGHHDPADRQDDVQEPTLDDRDVLSDRQLDTLAAVYRRPEASQQALADELDVTRATISRRLNAIPGFEWSERAAFATDVFETAPAVDLPEGSGGPDSDAADDDAVDDAAADGSDPSGDAEPPEPDEPAELAEPSKPSKPSKQQAANGEAGAESSPPADATTAVPAVDPNGAATEAQGREAGVDALPPELVHKVAHACMASDALSEEEELTVLAALMDR
jgi:hypothetical protein